MNISNESVKLFSASSQLQEIRIVKKKEAYLLALSFYPEPGWLLMGLGEHSVGSELSEASQVPTLSLATLKNIPKVLAASSVSMPLGLYLKAHFKNQRLSDASFAESEFGVLCLSFIQEGAPLKLSFGLSKPATLVAECEVPGRKLYKTSLGPLLILKDDVFTQEEETLEKAPPVAEVPQKWLRLLQKVAQDRDEALEWIHQLGPFCEALKENANLWLKPQAVAPELRARVEQLMAQKKLPPWGAAYRAEAFEKLFQLRRRMQTKVEKASLRLKDLEKQGVPQERAPSSRNKALPGKSALIEGPGKLQEEKPKAKPGLWVELSEGLWARVGRTAVENDELFRQQRDRDLWFHVRSQRGAHVWIARGQKAWPAKAELSENHVREACQLALFNSKLTEGSVDYTERRYLKKAKGSPGKLLIQRSKTKFVKLTSEFERLLKRK